ncbi:Uncharacterised protein [Mycobacterium tuberculosis]|uniref:Uncharacterized protein n=1 Tax=Mycobacterium tuberculosis TaxID=1773 RepID=A0A0T9E835_MYCTX|nr:Uncharacterised protein [Mycobacterium tuberculosis]CKR84511.1 Uncharacterised protein [Mycobacterium tuberculosis]CKS93647.1 Uncharacterised protein [Mycobacterium tuberculosis]CKT21544.1 Uncharacterised protein [Mycobacterium tuberculosis]COW31393.1 Uncharacterised protein [Mycobacterium tuberculosis]
MRGSDHFVVTPPIAVEHVTFAAAAPGYGAQVGRELTWGEEAPAALQQLFERSTDVRCNGHGMTLLVMSGVGPGRRRATALAGRYGLAGRAALRPSSPGPPGRGPLSSTSGISMDGRQRPARKLSPRVQKTIVIATGMQTQVNVLSRCSNQVDGGHRQPHRRFPNSDGGHLRRTR